jgi:small subunit ribosomal protein S20
VITDQKGAKEAIPSVESMIDKLAKRGIIHKNKAANLKSKLAKRVNALATA